ncbi:hypothetical protein Thal_1125 [Thermocrinis albus DSM 14484]|uniref:Response regulator receiver protein n=1 Tax=Thermocrinis albus (strain DSM 14484 / JCM 11386 / HI 11/12) TaxID=638303 RepID=D3SLX7_THEAH|nr:hypothetical protein [Thermocrinis albus]ADC89757.1 hypothetical protein Thal_1125 [Thermocrinis albus DSM 14484]
MKVVLWDRNLITAQRIRSLLAERGVEVKVLSSYQAVEDFLKEVGDAAVFVNLEALTQEDALINIKRTYPHVKLVGYCGHKNVSLQEKAKSMGVDLVVPNSVITMQPYEVLKKVLPGIWL